MSKHQALRAIKNEIKRLNQEIDIRIIKGLSYKDLSKRHKLLMSQLNNMTSHSWLSRSFARSFGFAINFKYV